MKTTVHYTDHYRPGDTRAYDQSPISENPYTHHAYFINEVFHYKHFTVIFDLEKYIIIAPIGYYPTNAATSGWKSYPPSNYTHYRGRPVTVCGASTCIEGAFSVLAKHCPEITYKQLTRKYKACQTKQK